MKFASTAARLSILVLAACGGSDDELFLPGPAGLDALILEFDGLGTKIEPLDASTSLPAEDGVTMNGVMAVLDLDSLKDDGYVGDFTATVNFMSGDMTSSATGFYYQNGEAPGVTRAGTVTLNSVDIGDSLDVALFTGVIGGSLDTGGGLEALSGMAEGIFGGPLADVMVAIGEADVVGELQTLSVIVFAD